ncbi:hypothetical protein GA0115254_11419 [Streptomyces sp. Ncost-T10-10d]|nr:hypothetical protein GA0115254_11419 [Streptomyces sp. Ncost-T10-10d]
MELRPETSTLEQRALALFCEDLSRLREECAQDAGLEQQLGHIVAEARARRPIAALLEELLGTSLDSAVRALGSGLPGSGQGWADEERYGCPDHACALVRQPPPAGPVPRCSVTGRPMCRL